MYQVKRSRIVEQLEIDDNGNKVVLNVDISADAILREYNKAQYSRQHKKQKMTRTCRQLMRRWATPS